MLTLCVPTTTKKRHFGNWLKWKRRNVPAKLFWKGDTRNYYNLEAKAEPGRLSSGTIAMLAEALRMEPAEVLEAWKHDDLSEPPIGAFTIPPMSTASFKRLAAAAKRAKLSIDELIAQTWP